MIKEIKKLRSEPGIHVVQKAPGEILILAVMINGDIRPVTFDKPLDPEGFTGRLHKVSYTPILLEKPADE